MPLDNNMPNAFIRGAASLSPETEAMIARREQLLGPAYRLFYQRPLNIVRGEGVWLYDEEGRAYLDAYNNVASVGHCHPKVVEAIARQSALLATHMRYLHGSILTYAERLLATMPKGIDHLMVTCSGSEANDLALRIAFDRTGGEGIIITEFGYHGVTRAVSEFSPSLGRNVNLGAHVRTVPAPNAYRSPTGDVAKEFEANVRTAIADLQRHGIKPAMFICDSLFTSDGVMAEPRGFLKGAVDAIHEAGGLYIADEVQPGFGRTGEAMWGFERHGVSPDIVTLGKPMGNGYPVAGCAMRHDVVEDFGRKSRFFNTFAGNPVAMEAALATLDVIQSEGLQENALRVGNYFRQGIDTLAGRHDLIGNVRHAGLFAGIEIVSDRQARTGDGEAALRIVNGLRDEGVLISAAGTRQNVLKIRPPLVFSRDNADLFVEKLDKVLTGLGRR